MNKKPNVVFVFGDQWRQQATGYAGDPNVKTPNLHALARESINFTHALSGCSVCSPYRASMLTGQLPMTHGVFVNDVYLQPRATSIAQAFSSAGYDTAYIGKWHVDGPGRSNYIPPERRLGFDYWKVLECTHDYNHSAYYAGDSDEKLYWDGYDAIAQTRDAETYIRNHNKDHPFFLVLSWGPPHCPYNTAPEKFRRMYDVDVIELRPNVPAEIATQAREELAGYYANCSALDTCIGDLLTTLRECRIENDTIVVFTSDHGDMLGSQGQTKKQRPWDESIRVPFLLRYPGLPGWQTGKTDALIDAPDIMPTLLSLCSISIPETVEGLDFSKHIAGGNDPSDGAAVIMCPQPFGNWNAKHHGGREYRGLRTKRYTYVRDLDGPWLLYDNEVDPYQMQNLIHDKEASGIRDELDRWLQKKLDDSNDEFLPGANYIAKWGYRAYVLS
ncbi:sulfatase [bacterium]|nr:sulfatase [bacterium]